MAKTQVTITAFGQKKKILADLHRLPDMIKNGTEKALGKIAAKGEQIVVLHLRNQDFAWQPLDKKTLNAKKKQGQSMKTLIATTTYLQSITSEAKPEQAFIGIKKGTKSKEGEDLTIIAAVHEYGSLKKNIKPRKLWGPSVQELKDWIRSSRIILKEIEKA